MTGRPTISVAIPVYNGADYLAAALDSILGQTDQDFEVAVSDNASTDDTPRILAEFAAKRPRVVVSRSDQLLKQGDNINRAVSLCGGDWVKMLCHDDLLEPTCIETLRAVLERTDTTSVGVIGHDEQWLMNGHLTSAPKQEPEISRWNGREYLRGLFQGRPGPGVPSLTTAMVKKAAFDGTSGFDARFLLMDIFYWYRLLLRWDYVFVNKILTVNRIHEGQVAVAGRVSMRSVLDHTVFWPEYLAEAADLRLGWKAVARLKLKPQAQAATFIAIELMKKRYSVALTMLRQLPLWWWPLVLALVSRAYVRETIRTRALAREVGLSVIYPDGSVPRHLD